MSISDFARQLGIETCLEFSPELLIPEQRIRDLCLENICGNYDSHYRCPPFGGSLEEIRARLGEFHRGILLQYSKSLDVRGDNEGLKQSKIEFHTRILQLEQFLRNEGMIDVWGMIGGSCELCQVCQVKPDGPCTYPDKARMSFTAIAVDILALLKRFGLDNEFHPDKVTWTGCILF